MRRDTRDPVDVVGGDDEGVFSRQRVGEPARHLRLMRGVLKGHGFVEQQQRRTLQHGLREGDALAFAAREFEHGALRERGEVESGEAAQCSFETKTPAP
jgi:hypothetical protein